MTNPTEKNLKLHNLWQIFLMVAIPLICASGISAIPYKLRVPLIYATGIGSVIIFIFSNKKIKLNAVNVSMFLLLGYLAIQLLYSYDPKATLNLLAIYTCAFTLLFMNAEENTLHKILTIMYVFCLVIAISIIISVPIYNCMLTYFKFIVNPSNSPAISESIINELSIGSYSGFAREKGEAAFIMNIGLAITFSNYFGKNKLCKKDALSLIIFLSALILTGKRMMFVIPIICFVVFMAFSKVKNKAMKTSSIILLAIVALFFILMFMPNFANVFHRFMDADNMATLGSRDSLWKYMSMMVSQFFLFGAGFGSYNSFAYDNGLRVYDERWNYNGHNSYYQAFAELGLVGSCLFIAFILSALFITFKYIKSDKFSNSQRQILFFAFYIQIMITVYAITGNPIYTNQMIFSLFFATGATLCIGNQVYNKPKTISWEHSL